MEFTAHLAARWVDAEKQVAELSDAYQRDTQRLSRERDETDKLVEMLRTKLNEMSALARQLEGERDDLARDNGDVRGEVRLLSDKLERSEQAAEFMSTDLNERADNDDLELRAEVARYHAALEEATHRNRAQEQMILEARRQRDEADQRANQLADERDAWQRTAAAHEASAFDNGQRCDKLEGENGRLRALALDLEAKLDAARFAAHGPQGVPKDGPPPIRTDGAGLDAQTIAGLIRAQGSSLRVVSPYLVGQWAVLTCYHDHVQLTPTFGPAHEQWTLDAPLRWVQLDDAKF